MSPVVMELLKGVLRGLCQRVQAVGRTVVRQHLVIVVDNALRRVVGEDWRLLVEGTGLHRGQHGSVYTVPRTKACM